jgi:hypothetical protein
MTTEPAPSEWIDIQPCEGADPASAAANISPTSELLEVEVTR